jgi:hypothetical protein
MPSLREWYDKLSEALHSAREGAPLFETAKAQIERHFDIRRVFKIPVAVEVKTAAVSGNRTSCSCQRIETRGAFIVQQRTPPSLLFGIELTRWARVLQLRALCSEEHLLFQ